MDELKFIIPGKPAYLTMIRLAISSIATTAGFDLDAIDDIKTAVSEACKNISCHGYDGFSEQYELDCIVEQGRIEITIQDGDSHSIFKDKKPCKHCPQEGDLGVYVIKTLVNEVDFGISENGNKRITMVKRV
jgi:serine/threonine-protein kinase RsbW